jgi:signal transduction histidine kinase
LTSRLKALGRRLAGFLGDPRAWVWGAVVVSLLVVGSIAWVHVRQVAVQQRALGALNTLREARVDLAKGFLYVSLSNQPGSPFSYQDGVALLEQAIGEFEDSRDRLEAAAGGAEQAVRTTSVQAFSDAVVAFQTSLTAWLASGTRRADEETRLRSAFYELEREAVNLDTLNQAALHEDERRLNRIFAAVAIVAGVLLLAICLGLYFAGASRRKSEAALQESERRRLEQAEQLQQTRRLEAIGRLAGGVAHDLNNLLTPILGYGEMLLGDMSKADPRRPMVTEMNKAATRAADLVHQLLAFGRRQSLAIRPVDLNKVIRDMMPLMRRTIRESVAIELRLSPTTPAIAADIVQIEQVILNLVVNAQDAMPGGGTLTVATEKTFLEGRSEQDASPLPAGVYALLLVQDTGTGMDAETKARVFEPFFTTKGLGEGTGLGLATVHGIVRQHKGDIALDSEPGMGTTFRVYFPAAAGVPEAGVVEEGGQAEPAEGEEGRAVTILLAEEDPLVRGLAGRLLARDGYAVLEAATGAEAEDLVTRSGTRIGLLVAEVVMPDVSGFELYDRLHATNPSLKVIYLYDDGGGERAWKDPESGVDRVRRQFVAAELSDKVWEVLDRGAVF